VRYAASEAVTTSFRAESGRRVEGTGANFQEEELVSAKITMTNGTQFVATGSATAATLTKAFERRSFAEVESTEGTVYINPAHVAYVRDE
jgi:hypothetical protein